MKQYTINRWISRYITLLLLPMIILIIGLFAYMTNYMTKQTITLAENNLKTYTEQFSNELATMERYLLTIYDNNEDLPVLSLSSEQVKINMAKISYANHQNRQLLNFPQYDGLFTTVSNENEFIRFTTPTDGHLDIEQMIEDARITAAPYAISFDRWFVYQCDCHSYLIRATRKGNMVCGAWRNLDTLAEKVNDYCKIKSAGVLLEKTVPEPIILSSDCAGTDTSRCYASCSGRKDHPDRRQSLYSGPQLIGK